MPENFTEQSLQMAIEASNNLSLADSLLKKITRVKMELYPAIKESEQVNESARQVNLILKTLLRSAGCGSGRSSCKVQIERKL